MLVLGVDPGSRITGWGLVEAARGRYRHVASGILRPKEDASLADRLVVIHAGLVEVLAAYHPEEAAVEAIFHHKSALSALKLGHARGVALLAIAQAGLVAHEYPATLVKQVVSGYGGADKKQVSRMIGLLLGEIPEGPADVTDALAIAITHLTRSRAAHLTPVAPGPFRARGSNP